MKEQVVIIYTKNLQVEKIAQMYQEEHKKVK